MINIYIIIRVVELVDHSYLCENAYKSYLVFIPNFLLRRVVFVKAFLEFLMGTS